MPVACSIDGERYCVRKNNLARCYRNVTAMFAGKSRFILNLSDNVLWS